MRIRIGLYAAIPAGLAVFDSLAPSLRISTLAVTITDVVGVALEGAIAIGNADISKTGA